jgi:hypothetical protein
MTSEQLLDLVTIDSTVCHGSKGSRRAFLHRTRSERQRVAR